MDCPNNCEVVQFIRDDKVKGRWEIVVENGVN